MEAYRELQDWWKAGDSAIETEEIAEDRIVALKRRYGIRLPADFRDYFRKSSPTAGEQWDDNACCWWSFDRIRNIPEEFTGTVGPAIGDDAQHYLFFCDYTDWSWAWAICCAPNTNYGKIAFIGGGEYDTIVADSFSEFVQNYVTDWYLVSHPAGRLLTDIEPIVREIAARIGAREIHLPTFGASSDFGRPHIEITDAYHWVVVERGQEIERRTTSRLDDLLYWIFQYATFKTACDYEVRHRRTGEDCRRLIWSRQLELLGAHSYLWKERCRNEIAVTLSAHPFQDGGPAGLDGV